MLSYRTESVLLAGTLYRSCFKYSQYTQIQEIRDGNRNDAANHFYLVKLKGLLPITVTFSSAFYKPL